MSLVAPHYGRPRVVVADDSALMRRMVTDVVTRAGIQVVGTAANGDEALELCRRLSPDAMTLDLSMPGMGGIDVLRSLRAGGLSIPVVVVSAFSPAQGAYAVDALSEGAFELVSKPSDAVGIDAFESTLVHRLRLAVSLRLVPRPGTSSAAAASPPVRVARPAPAPPAVVPPAPGRTRSIAAGARRTRRVVVIAISTGGPRALAALMPALPGQLGLGTLIVQHMPAGFTESLAARLNRSSALTIREATDGAALDAGVALVAPGGRHLRLDDDARVRLSDEDPIGGLRPRADLTIADAARHFGERMLLVVMTGMGNDGLRGATEVRRHGGRVIAEAQESCAVYGMPRAVADAQLADEVLPLDELATAIQAEVCA